jgi:hypothetical protein
VKRAAARNRLKKRFQFFDGLNFRREQKGWLSDPCVALQPPLRRKGSYINPDLGNDFFDVENYELFQQSSGFPAWESFSCCAESFNLAHFRAMIGSRARVGNALRNMNINPKAQAWRCLGFGDACNVGPASPCVNFIASSR